MADWPLQDVQAYGLEGKTSDTTAGTLITGGVANTKGAYPATPISTSTPFHASGVYIVIGDKSASADYLIDIAIGAAGSETIIIANLTASGTSSTVAQIYFFPIPIPAGVRLNARCQSTTASATLKIHCVLINAGWHGLPTLGRRVETLGAATADSGGTAVTNPTVANTKGAWVQIGAATTFPYRYIIPAIGAQGIATRTSGQDQCFDVGSGSSGAQRIVVPDVIYFTTTSNAAAINGVLGSPVSIPSGTNLWMRYSSSALTTLGYDGFIYGIGG